VRNWFQSLLSKSTCTATQREKIHAKETKMQNLQTEIERIKAGQLYKLTHSLKAARFGFNP
jgi:formate dehydrogenase assembly factor FdhD